MATSTIHGVRFSDTLAALLDHAEATEGWRVEPDTRGRGGGVVIYPADKTVSPITVTERGAKFNRPHYENIRRDLYRAGLPPLPTDKPTTTATPEEPAVPTAARKKPVKNVRNIDEMAAMIGPDAPDRAAALAGLVDGLFSKTGDLEAFSDLAAGLIYATAAWAEQAAEGLTGAAMERARTDAATEISDALTLAADAEAKAGRLETALAKSDADLKKAREDCAAALDRAKVAEAEAAQLRGALAPLRALLGNDK